MDIRKNRKDPNKCVLCLSPIFTTPSRALIPTQAPNNATSLPQGSYGSTFRKDERSKALDKGWIAITEMMCSHTPGTEGDYRSEPELRQQQPINVYLIHDGTTRSQNKQFGWFFPRLLL